MVSKEYVVGIVAEFLEDITDITNLNIENKANLSCSIIKETYKSGSDQKYSCIGFGDCARICPQQAIVIENGMAVITDLCNGCGQCLEICPQKLIKMAEKDVKISSLINSEDSEKSTELIVPFPILRYFSSISTSAFTASGLQKYTIPSFS